MKQSIRWAMVIDLRKCIGCGTCVVACGQSNKITSNHWRRIFDCGISTSPDRRRLFLPLNCMHCSQPACKEVCPTGATTQRHDGIVYINSKKCIGCGYCITACPYYARVILYQNEYGLEARIMAGEPTISIPDYLGVASKCCFCSPRVDRGIAHGLIPGKDPEATPACVNNCPAKAMHFGDLNDPRSEVAQLIQENQCLCLQAPLETQPRVYYIADSALLKDRLS